MALPVDVHNLLFRPDGMVEITYAETREQGPKVAVIRTIVFERKLFDDLRDIEEAIIELIDLGLRENREAPDTVPLRRETP